MDDEKWRAVMERDPQAEFVYAVRTTRVYCRPTCPSRRPRRENVQFFPFGVEAQRRGYRACLRCRPDDGAPSDPAVARVRDACALLAAAEGAAPSVGDLASATHTTPDALRRDFRRVLGVSPKQYADALRVERLRDELRDGRDVTGALYRAGYGSSSRLYEQSDARLGMTPASYGAGGAGARIRFTTADSNDPAFGAVLVATTDRGICRVCLGPDPAALEAILRGEFHAAAVSRDDATLAPIVGEVLQRIAGAAPSEELPLDVRGTAFQRRVWQELQRIPRGETRSYGAVAAAVGAPGAARAVGQACGSNPTAVVVPCHRVVPSGGGLGGFAWGLDAKRTLLDHEHDAVGDGERVSDVSR